MLRCFQINIISSLWGSAVNILIIKIIFKYFINSMRKFSQFSQSGEKCFLFKTKKYRTN